MIQYPIGILGGGQLARMLLLSAHPLGLETSVFVAQKSEPAAQVCGQSFVGSLDNEDHLKNYTANLSALTFESEFVDTDKLARCLPKSLNVFPRLDVISQIQDRLPQKQLLDTYKIPTAPWMPVQSEADLKQASGKFKNGFVLKQRRFGYDGYGTFFCRDGRIDPSWLQKTKHGFIAEAAIPFRRELAISFVRSSSGAFLTLPLVETVQRDARCFTVKGPVQHAGIKSLSQRCKRLMNEIGYVGILAAELFDVGRELLVNELAPRVHNSAHYSMDALSCSQFEYHLRAGLDWPLPKLQLVQKGFAMVNLLGEGGKVQLSRVPLGHLHWYGKGENRKGRKMGHINVLGHSGTAALTQALKWRKDFKL